MEDVKGQLEFGLEEAGNLNSYIDAFNTDDGYEPQANPVPTDHKPGSWCKVEVLADRLENAEELWHDSDAKLPRKKTQYELLTGFLIDSEVSDD